MRISESHHDAFPSTVVDGRWAIQAEKARLLAAYASRVCVWPQCDLTTFSAASRQSPHTEWEVPAVARACRPQRPGKASPVPEGIHGKQSPHRRRFDELSCKGEILHRR